MSYVRNIIIYIHIHVWRAHSLARTVEEKRNGRSYRNFHEEKKRKKKTERTNCTTVGICVHENAEEQSEARYFPDTYASEMYFYRCVRKIRDITYLKSLS